MRVLHFVHFVLALLVGVGVAPLPTADARAMDFSASEVWSVMFENLFGVEDSATNHQDNEYSDGPIVIGAGFGRTGIVGRQRCKHT